MINLKSKTINFETLNDDMNEEEKISFDKSNYLSIKSHENHFKGSELRLDKKCCSPQANSASIKKRFSMFHGNNKLNDKNKLQLFQNQSSLKRNCNFSSSIHQIESIHKKSNLLRKLKENSIVKYINIKKNNEKFKINNQNSKRKNTSNTEKNRYYNRRYF